MAEETVGLPLSIHDPRRVGPWTVKSRLGAGGMGVVYHAHDRGRAAAVKVIRPGLLDAAATRERFSREVAILRSVRDVHISQFLDADLASEPAWLAIEYVSGPVLRDQVLAHGPLPPDRWWELARGLAQALAVLEVHRVTHRDIKPANVILNERGPVLIDFGIAHPEDATSLTATGLVTGSPAWLSPEQANLEPTGPASDVFCLGSLLAFAATGRPPFGEGASVAVLVSIATRDPDLAGVDDQRCELLRRMLAKPPGDRPSAREVLGIARRACEDLTPPVAGAALAPLAPASPAVLPPDDATAQLTPAARDVDATRVAEASGPDTAETGTNATFVGHPVPPAPSSREAGVRDVVGPPAARPGASGSAVPGGAGRVRGDRRPPAGRRSGRALVVAVAAILALVVGWLAVTSLSGGGGDDTGTSAPDVADAPPAPASDSLRADDWLLESYRLVNDDAGGLSVTGTVRNVGQSTASADLTVWIYVGSDPLGSVTTSVADVPAGGSTPVTMSGNAQWRAGQKVILLQAS